MSHYQDYIYPDLRIAPDIYDVKRMISGGSQEVWQPLLRMHLGPSYSINPAPQILSHPLLNALSMITPTRKAAPIFHMAKAATRSIT